MYSLMDSTGSNMPMKMMPMKPAIKNSISGSANATAVFRLRSRSVFGDDGDAHQFAVELAAFFRDGNHFQRRAGKKNLAIREALAEPSALLHALDGLADGVHENLVADGAARDVQAVHERHARADQRAEHPAEARHRKLRDERADQRRFQNQALPDALAFFGSEPGAHQKNDGHDQPAATNNP